MGALLLVSIGLDCGASPQHDMKIAGSKRRPEMALDFDAPLRHLIRGVFLLDNKHNGHQQQVGASTRDNHDPLEQMLVARGGDNS